MALLFDPHQNSSALRGNFRGYTLYCSSLCRFPLVNPKSVIPRSCVEPPVPSWVSLKRLWKKYRETNSTRASKGPGELHYNVLFCNLGCIYYSLEKGMALTSTVSEGIQLEGLIVSIKELLGIMQSIVLNMEVKQEGLSWGSSRLERKSTHNTDGVMNTFKRVLQKKKTSGYWERKHICCLL